MKRTCFPKDASQIVVFDMDEMHCALGLSVVERVIRSVEITPLPNAPEIVTGVINFQGRIIPVADVRKRFNLPLRGIELNDRFIIARTSERIVALTVDSVAGVRDVAGMEMSVAGQAIPSISYIQGIARLDNDIIFIYDLDRFLSIEEEEELNKALAGSEA